MSRLVSSLSITIDGFCDHTTAVADEEHHQLSAELLERAAMVVLGRATYGLFESFWPQVPNDKSLPDYTREFAPTLNKIRKVVVSKTLDHADWENSIVISDLRKLMLLKQQSAKDLLIFGSPGLVSSLTKKGMIDEYIISVQPVIAGKGKHLFTDVIPDSPLNLKLTATKTFTSGVVTSFYSKHP